MLTGLLQQSVISGLTTGCVYAIVGICVVLIFKSARFPDFAQGTWIVLGGMLGASFFARGLPLWLSMILAVLSTALLGAACWIVFLHGPMKRGMSGLHLCMITVGLAMGIAAVLQMTIGTRSMSLPPFAKIEPIHLSKVTISPQAPWLWLTLLLTMFGLVFLFNHTYWGKQIRACHQRHLGAILIGLNPSRIAIFIYAFAAGLAGILGVAMAGMIPVVYHRGTSLILMGFIVYLVGGATSLPGAVIAGLAIGLIESLTAAFISTNYMDIVPLSITIVFLLFRPTGLFGESEPGEK